MYGLEIYHRVRRAVLRDGMSERAAALDFGVDRGAISKVDVLGARGSSEDVR